MSWLLSYARYLMHQSMLHCWMSNALCWIWLLMPDHVQFTSYVHVACSNLFYRKPELYDCSIKLRVWDGVTWRYTSTGEAQKNEQTSGYIIRSKVGSLQMCLHTLPATASASRRYMAFPFSQLKNTSQVGESCSGANLTELWEEICQIQCEFQLLFSNLYSNFGKAGRVKTNPLATCLWAASMSPWTHIAMCLRVFVCVTARQQLPLWKMHWDWLQKYVCLTY